MIEKFYTKLELWRKSSGGWTGEDGFSFVREFRGLIQKSNVSKNYRNAKDGQAINAVLFTGVSEVFQIGDKIKEPISGINYFISGINSQPLGVAGLKPNRGQHCEYDLVYDDEAT